MARPRIYYDYELPSEVVQIVRGIVADYERRENAIKFSNVSGDVLSRYVEFNRAVDTALSVVDKNIRDDIMKDVALNRGYDFSLCSVHVSKCTYYLKKRQFIFSVANELNLIPKK